jgi:hypothetical protein
MKTLSKVLIIMLLSLLLIIIVRCDNKDDFDPDSAICQLTTLTFNSIYIFFNSVIEHNETIVLKYDTNERVIEWTLVREHFTASYDLTYNDEGQIENIQFTVNNEPFGDYVFTWQGNTATVDFLRIEGEAFESDERCIITFNENEEITLVEHYYYFTEEKSWTKVKEYCYTWVNDNINKIEEYYMYYEETYGKKSNSLINQMMFSVYGNKEGNCLRYDKEKSESKELVKICTNTFIYDNKKSPLTNKFPYFIINHEIPFASKNNIVKFTTTSHPDNSVSSVNYTYKYNKYNYPTERLFKASGPDWSSTQKYIFEYSCN